MPELPEVETIRRDLSNIITNNKLIKIEVRDKKMINGSTKAFTDPLLGKSFLSVQRIGKLLIFEISDKKNFLLIHLKMTGQLVYTDKAKITAGGHSIKEGNLKDSVGGDLPNKHSHLIFHFAKGQKLYFNDIRKFGYAKIVGQDELEIIKKPYGIEPLTPTFTLTNLKKSLEGKTTNIKVTILNQRIIAGIGNIYADEILFVCGINPERKTNTITDKEIAKIYQATQAILKKAVKHRGTTFSDYVDASGKMGNYSQFLKVYKKNGEQCPNCKNTIQRIKLMGRGTHFCSNCQK